MGEAAGERMCILIAALVGADYMEAFRGTRKKAYRAAHCAVTEEAGCGSSRQFYTLHSSGAIRVQYTQPPKGSLTGIPSQSTSDRLRRSIRGRAATRPAW